MEVELTLQYMQVASLTGAVTLTFEGDATIREVAVPVELLVLEPDEAESFVIKLWRYLIFETMRSQAGLL